MLATEAASTTETVHFAPDDSDLMDFTQADVQQAAPAAPTAPTTAGARPVPALVHGLTPVSHRFWFAVFSQTDFPDADTLNAGDGLAHARFPADLAPSARPPKMHWFCIDEDLVYLSFSNDWGPLNIAMFYRFCVHVHQMLIDDAMAPMHLCLYTSADAHRKANAALLCALYAMTIDHISPADAFHPYSELELKPFRDAGYGRADFSLTLQDILYGMRRALDHELLDLTTFDLEEYEHYEQVQNGDWNWITPHFLAFASPKDKAYMAMLAASGGQPCAVPHTTAKPTGLLRSTIDYFAARRVGLVVRLNNPLYNRKAFEAAGIAHRDLYFDDGSNPSDEIVHTFITEADRTIAQGNAIAVHCKAGLGRTGVLIGAYLIWKYQFSANEAIGYMRMMRPGCVVGPQQHYMYEHAPLWMRWGIEHRLRAELQSAIPKTPCVKRAQDAVATPRTAPTTKPTPCVGQPRKSPSPKRRRVGLLGAGDTEDAHDGADATPRRVSDERDAVTVEQLTGTARSDEEVLGVLSAADEARDARPRAVERRGERRGKPAASGAASPAARAGSATSSARPSPARTGLAPTGARAAPGAAPGARPAPSGASPVRPPAARAAERAASPARLAATAARVRRAMTTAPQPRATPAAPVSPAKMRAAPARGGENVPPTRARLVARPRP
ncbi:hypothetical protein MOBT1_001894 [Malassezia obtusa]|uniref:protein-tyrosine-phosphatase n=1 Tax=Malassezia obtusa TaxID=76774 RepID=A0AAF0E1A8_9BASI|nr:hypothetical protein MOBT1_001894 [Malassezia obtusa]